MTAVAESEVPPAATASRPPRRHGIRWIALTVAVVLVALVVVLATRDPSRNTSADSPLLGKAAPEVIGTGLDGATVRLSQFRGRYVLLNFFASWCGPCRNEHDDLVRFAATHEATGDAQVVSVLWDDEPDDARAYFAEEGGDWPVLVDDRGKVALDFGAKGPPETFLVDRNGFVRSRIVGEVTFAGLESLLAAVERADA